LNTERLGKWAIDVADEYVHADVRGFDLAPIQPTDIPYNCSFLLVDVPLGLEDDKTFLPGSIDLVHMR
jgi:hypothetical protein